MYPLPDVDEQVRRSLGPGEKPCPVRSKMYDTPSPHNRAYGDHGRCWACKPKRSKVIVRDRIYDWWHKRRYRREKARYESANP